MNSEFVHNVIINKINIDKTVGSIIAKAIPNTGIRAPLPQGNEKLIDIYSLQNPIITYLYKDKYYLRSG